MDKHAHSAGLATKTKNSKSWIAKYTHTHRNVTSFSAQEATTLAYRHSCFCYINVKIPQTIDPYQRPMEHKQLFSLILIPDKSTKKQLRMRVKNNFQPVVHFFTLHFKRMTVTAFHKMTTSVSSCLLKVFFGGCFLWLVHIRFSLLMNHITVCLENIQVVLCKHNCAYLG